jgi:hypothetical protein
VTLTKLLSEAMRMAKNFCAISFEASLLAFEQSISAANGCLRAYHQKTRKKWVGRRSFEADQAQVAVNFAQLFVADGSKIETLIPLTKQEHCLHFSGRALPTGPYSEGSQMENAVNAEIPPFQTSNLASNDMTISVCPMIEANTTFAREQGVGG